MEPENQLIEPFGRCGMTDHHQNDRNASCGIDADAALFLHNRISSSLAFRAGFAIILVERQSVVNIVPNERSSP